MPSPRYLTKSRFKLAVECPTKLYYASHPEYGNVKDGDPFLQMLAEGGYQVGELAKCLYPEGIEVRDRNHADAESLTLELLERDRVVLFEPALRFGDLFVRVDILVKDGNDFQLIEVKAKSYDSTDPKRVGLDDDIPAAMRPYIEDVAFQRFVLNGAIPGARVSAFLLMPDKSVAVTIDGMNQLFEVSREGSAIEVTRSPRLATEGFGVSPLAMVNVDALVERVLTEGVRTSQGFVPLKDVAQTWALAFSEDRRIPPLPGAQCASCEFQSTSDKSLRSGLVECWKEVFGLDACDFAKGTVLDLWNCRRKQALIDARRVRLDDVRREDLGAASDGPGLSIADRQWMQVKGIPPAEDRGGYWIARDLMRAEMAGWRYPLHMIDFETSAVALPFHRGMRPYEQVAFQFSHHVMHADGRVEHAGDFLTGRGFTSPCGRPAAGRGAARRSLQPFRRPDPRSAAWRS